MLLRTFNIISLILDMCKGDYVIIAYLFTLQCTVISLSFQTDWSGQTVQIQIRVYTVCNSLCIVGHITLQKSQHVQILGWLPVQQILGVSEFFFEFYGSSCFNAIYFIGLGQN